MNSFGNIITQTVLRSDDATFFPGQVFSGYFQYDSMEADGTFYVANEVASSPNRTLKGVIYLPFPQGGAQQNSLPVTMNDGYLTVSGGVVTAFEWSIQNGDAYASFSDGQFFARLTGRTDPQTGEALADIETSGTVVFGVPTRQS